MTDWTWRNMQGGDLEGVSRVAVLAFPDHPEATERFAERLRLSPDSCFVLADGAEIAGYLIAYRWPVGRIPPLDMPIDALPEADTLYLHDLALLPSAIGHGYAAEGIDLIVGWAGREGYRLIALVSVNESVAFWARHGFAEVPRDAALAKKLASYGADARYMVRSL